MVYFDNAATTFPKPPSVVNEMIKCMTSYCGNPGRSGHTLSLQAAEKIYECREEIAYMFGINNPTNVIFTPNTTFAINIAIHAFLRKKTHILISDIEHNSVLRTVSSLSKYGIDYDIFTVFPNDVNATLKSLKSKLRSNTHIIVCSHVSNVCGISLPIKQIGMICKQFSIKFIVDGAQSTGSHKINVNECNIDALCSPGHKGLYGPQGTGFILFSDKYSDVSNVSKLNPFIFGGNGVNSADINMPDFLPERFEAGTLNTVGIAGLLEGVKFVKQIGEDLIFDNISMLYNRALDMLTSLPDITVYCKDINKSSCLLFNVKDINSDTVADMLNSDNICVRAGLHCSPLVHKKLKTEKGGVRISFSYFNTMSELEYFYKSIKNIVFKK